MVYGTDLINICNFYIDNFSTWWTFNVIQK